MNEPRNISREVLPNGMVIITEPMPYVRSVSVGIWNRCGSRCEPAAHNGIAHFIEHMFFKGTERRSAEEIARSIDSIGGMMDAYTAKEMVCFNAKVLDEHLPLAWEVLSDLVLGPLFDGEEITREKQVVLEEIKMDQDNPEYLVHELLMENFWRDHPLGLPILGTPETVQQFSRAPVMESFRRWYAPNHLVVTAAGHIEHAQLVDLVTRAFAALPAVPNGAAPSAPGSCAVLATQSKRELEQVHLCIGVPSVPLSDNRRYAISVLNTILGGGMSSRLFQNIRERQGLAYAVFSELSPYSDAGLLTVYAGTALDKTEKVIRLVVQEFAQLKQELVTTEELRRAKDHLKGSLMLSLESTSARMSNLARQEMYFGRFFSMDEILEAIEGVTRESLQELAREYFRPELIAATAVGNLEGFQLRREQFAC
ncbi:MAG TPA: pitrilysin family protein [Candidatus Acidoferrales bacterium]|nr:pitrilysin family protein [Candidatus Acidoferrales bacterium]